MILGKTDLFFHGTPIPMPEIEGYELLASDNDWLKASKGEQGMLYFVGWNETEFHLTPIGTLRDGRQCADTDRTITIPRQP